MGLNVVTDAVAGLFKPAADAYGKHLDKKAAAATAKAKLLQAQVDNSHAVELSKLEQEMLTKQMEASTWKDEYALVLGSSPYILLFVGCILNGFGMPEFLDGVRLGLVELNNIGVEVGYLCAAAITTGLGIRLFRR